MKKMNRFDRSEKSDVRGAAQAGMLKTFLVLGLMASLPLKAQSLSGTQSESLATAENLSNFELKAPNFTDEELQDLRNSEAEEQDREAQIDLFENVMNSGQIFPVSNSGDTVQIEIYQDSKKVGKQFLLARHNGKIRYVFAVSTGKEGHSTPSGKFSVTGQLWRHMSSSYPSSGENNMDHLTYFKPLYGFHATTFAAYAKLSRRDSHGCVRLARPEARAVYRLIRKNAANTRILSMPFGTEPKESEVSLIKTQLAKDLNLIQMMLNTHNKGDVPFNESQYEAFKQGDKRFQSTPQMLKKMGIDKLIEISPDQDLGPGELKTVPLREV